MNKILLIILIGLVIVLLINNNKCEPFENVCNELQTNSKEQILKYNENLITESKFGQNIDIIINPFVNLNKIEPAITIEEYLVENNFPIEQVDQAVFLIKTIINNNCLMSALSEYDVTRKTLLKEAVQTYLLDNLKNNLICLISDKKAIELVIQQIGLLIVKPYVEICSKEKFVEYCEANYTQVQQEVQDVIVPKIVTVVSEAETPGGKKKKMCKVANKKQIEKFANELSATANEIKSGSMSILDIEAKMLPLVSNSPKFMDVESIDTIIRTFDSDSLGPDVQLFLKELMDLYRVKYNRALNIGIKADFTNFVLLLIDEYNGIIEELRGDNLCEDEEDSSIEIENLVNKFNGYKKIYYMLKHYYKIVGVYELINSEVKENDVKLQAMLCCTRHGDKTCHNFSSDIKNPSSIIYGFSDYGYVNAMKCVQGSPEAKANEEEQKLKLDDILSSKYELWKNISRENKVIIFGSIINLLKIHGIQLKSIDGTLGEIRKNIKNSGNKISLGEVTKILIVKPSDVINRLNISSPDYDKSIEQIDKAENIDTIRKILANYGFTNEQIVFNSNVVFDIAKSISKVILFAKFLFSNFNFSNSASHIVKLMGIANTKQTFNEIFAETNIVPRYFTLIQQAIMTSIQNGKFAVVGKYDMNSIPVNVINYIKSKPTDQSLNLCNVYGLAIDKFRKDRAITVGDYNDIDERMFMYCNPSSVNIDKITPANIPINESKGLNVLERTHPDYPTYVVEHNKATKNNMGSEIVSDNILYNFIKNTYN